MVLGRQASTQIENMSQKERRQSFYERKSENYKSSSQHQSLIQELSCWTPHLQRQKIRKGLGLRKSKFVKPKVNQTLRLVHRISINIY